MMILHFKVFTYCNKLIKKLASLDDLKDKLPKSLKKYIDFDVTLPLQNFDVLTNFSSS